MQRLLLFCFCAVLAVAAAGPGAMSAQAVPAYAVDPSWPKPLPNNWLLGQIGGMAVDKDDHIWVFQRPRTLSDDEKGAALRPPRSQCCVPAPPVLEFDRAGSVLRSWGGPGNGYTWFANEHGITVDRDGFVWLTGNGANDGQILKFTQDGKFVMQIGHEGPSEGSNSTTQLGQPASVFVDTAAHEAYVADGYKNRRIIVFDSTTGAYKRHWGAYGKPPNDDPVPAYDPKAPPYAGFRNPVHCVRVAQDGLVYVCDRTSNRYQIFRKDGTFVREVFVKGDTLGNGSMWDLTFTPDSGQPYLLNADGENNEVRVLARSSGSVLGTFGRNGRQAGEFHWVHAIVTDSHGDVYTGEVDTGKRIQKFRKLWPGEQAHRTVPGVRAFPRIPLSPRRRRTRVQPMHRQRRQRAVRGHVAGEPAVGVTAGSPHRSIASARYRDAGRRGTADASIRSGPTETCR